MHMYLQLCTKNTSTKNTFTFSIAGSILLSRKYNTIVHKYVHNCTKAYKHNPEYIIHVFAHAYDTACKFKIITG